MRDCNEQPVTWTAHDGKVISKQSRDFIDGFEKGVEHGRHLEREQAKYWEGFDRGMERGMAQARDMACASSD